MRTVALSVRGKTTALAAWRNEVFAVPIGCWVWMRVLTALLVCVWLGATQAAGAQSQTSGSHSSPAAAVVESLHQVLSENLRDGDALGFKGRLQRLQSVVLRNFDFPAIARVALGKAFDLLDSAGRTRFIRLLESLSVATYAEQFSGTDSPVRFVITAEQPARGGRILVRTHLERPADEPVALDYVLQNTAQGPRIVNVLANGVSDLSLKRAQYSAVIRNDGVDALFQRIEQQVRQLTNSHTGG
ncbi:MAG: phospholipid transport system substrate-binding protein [Gammaproteobacteria bacterium]|jgi:phospholipid transport system substrate-binding protein